LRQLRDASYLAHVVNPDPPLPWDHLAEPPAAIARVGVPAIAEAPQQFADAAPTPKLSRRTSKQNRTISETSGGGFLCSA
jgi:hypothetical protein